MIIETTPNITDTDTEKLITFLRSYGITAKALADILGVSKQLFAIKLKRRSFTEPEQGKLLEHLTTLAEGAKKLVREFTPPMKSYNWADAEFYLKAVRLIGPGVSLKSIN